MAEHTKGPWQVVGTEDGHYSNIQVLGPDGAFIVRVNSSNHPNMANARLIAAAPDLLEACKKLVELAEWLGTPPGYSWSEICEPVRLGNAAIAKAQVQP